MPPGLGVRIVVEDEVRAMRYMEPGGKVATLVEDWNLVVVPRTEDEEFDFQLNNFGVAPDGTLNYPGNPNIYLIDANGENYEV